MPPGVAIIACVNLAGVFPPVPTPFRSDGALDLDALSAHVERLNGTAVAGFLALGSNGEAPHLAPGEAESVYATVRKAAGPGKLVLSGTGQLSTHATIEMTRRAAGVGCDAVLVLTPFYYKGSMTHAAFVAHFTAVADASPVPVLIYNVPASTGLSIASATVAELSRHPNIAGMKDSAGDIGPLAETVRLTRGGKPFAVFCGSYPATLPALGLGIAGAILAVANVYPDECAALLSLTAAGRAEEARSLFLRLLPVARAVSSQHGVPGLKAALELLGRPCGVPRPPLLPLDEVGRVEIARLLRLAGS